MTSHSRNMVLIGDDLFLEYHHLLSSKLLYINPDTCPHLMTVHKTELSFASAIDLIPQYIIGKDPHYLLINLGSVEIESSKPLEQIFCEIDLFFQTIEKNIHTKKFILGSCEILFSNQPKKIKRLKKINHYLKTKFSQDFIDINTPAKKILKKVIANHGEKQAFYQAGPKLTSFGQVVFTESISKKISF